METRPEALVSLTIPSRPEYVCVVRLAISGVASRMDFSYDDIEDLKLAVAEACNTVMEDLGPLRDQSQVAIQCAIQEDSLTIHVCGVRPTPAGLRAAPWTPEEDLSLLLMRSLMDEVQLQRDERGGPCIRMIKRAVR